MKKFLIAAAALVAFAAPALAADMAPAPVYSKAAPLPVVAAYNWTGFYVGVNTGGGWGKTTGDQLPAFFSGNFSNSGGMVGGQVGFNYQVSNWVFGVEADWDWAKIWANTPDSPNFPLLDPFAVNDLGTVRGRVGYAWDRALFYATAGWAWSSNTNMFCAGCSVPFQYEAHSLNGYALGGGIEYGVTQNLSVKAEYIYAHLKPVNWFIPAGCPGPCTIGENVNTFRLGANWRFGGF